MFFSEGSTRFVGNVRGELIVILGVGFVGSSVDLGVVENLVGSEVVNLVLHTSIKTGNSINEHLDDLVEDLILVFSSELLGSIVSSDNVEVIDGVVKGGSRFEID